MKPTPEDYKEEKFDIQEKKLRFFTFKKLLQLFFGILLGFLGLVGLLLIIDVTVYPELGMVEMAVNARNKTEIWRTAKRTDMGHEAIAFEKMLDAYALQGGDISHVLDTLTDEFTPANWAELLEYDVDYFQNHDELSDSIKMNGMLHVAKLLYTSGHYDLFKQAYKILDEKFSSGSDYLKIYSELIQLKPSLSYDDEEEKEELEILYELELRRHLKLTAGKVVMAISGGEITSPSLQEFLVELKTILESESILASKGDRFKDQVETDLVHILSLAQEQAESENNAALLNASNRLAAVLVEKDMQSAADLIQASM